VSIRIARGEIVALLGPNGAGKSTLIKIWAGFEKPTKGSSQVAGHDAWRHRREALEHVAYVGQGSPLVKGLTAREHVDLALSLRRGLDRGGAVRRLERLQIPVDVPVRRLSGGQQSQVALGLALASSSTILLLDEPLANLDPLARRQFMAEAFADCRSSGRTLVLSSHVVSDVDPADNRLILLDHGRIKLDAPVRQLVANHYLTNAPRDKERVVGSVQGRDGSTTLLVESSAGRDGMTQASVEDVVLGYLAEAPRT
jgi:ABC-2 type transport system ATP-binding protein